MGLFILYNVQFYIIEWEIEIFIETKYNCNRIYINKSYFNQWCIIRKHKRHDSQKQTDYR